VGSAYHEMAYLGTRHARDPVSYVAELEALLANEIRQFAGGLLYVRKNERS
jgi:hypothetical protein